MGMITTKDGTEIYYKDWGTGQPIVFHHGWPLSADDWDNQMMFFLRTAIGSSPMTAAGMVALRKRSAAMRWIPMLPTSQNWSRRSVCRNAIHVGHSTGGGEVARYVAQHGEGRVAKAVLDQLGAAADGENSGQSRAVCPRTYSMDFRRSSSPTGLSSITTYRRGRFTATTGRAQKSRRE